MNESNKGIRSLSRRGMIIFGIIILALIATPILSVKVFSQMREIRALEQTVRDFELCTLHTVECDFEGDVEPYGPDEPVSVEQLRQYLEKENALTMIQYLDEIVELPRYIEVVAIIGHETSFCTKGVGDSRNNCGAIMNTKGEFKRYASKLDAIEDLAILLQNDRYINKSIAEMNGVYCQHEGGECPNWTENIEGNIDNMLSFAGK